jgi:hypothetical protein
MHARERLAIGFLKQSVNNRDPDSAGQISGIRALRGTYAFCMAPNLTCTNRLLMHQHQTL